MIYTRSLIALFTALILLTAGCATPVGVTHGTTAETVQRELSANALNAGKPSEWSNQVLYRNNLYESYVKDPAATIDILHKRTHDLVTPERLFALAELSFLYAQQFEQRSYYLAAAAYAYAFVLPENERTSLRPIDPRGRVAVDIYNIALSRAFTTPAGDVVLQPGVYRLPFGELTLTTDPAQFVWSGYRFKSFAPVGEYLVRGVRNRYRQYGVGAPLAAELEPIATGADAEAARRRIPPRTRVPVTAFARFEDPLHGIREGAPQAHLELYAADQTKSVRVGNREVPLELDPTAALALQLESAPIWDFELAGFRFGDEKLLGDGLSLLAPYRPGRIPVVFVHGTASSPARWAEMFNELSNDPVIGARYQFWIYQYNTGQPILYSAYLMRRALRATMAELDPTLSDEAFRRMVIIGHSQGGLLARLMVVRSDARFWNNVSKVPVADIEAPDELKAMLQEGMFFDPLPGIERVIFIATPQRGSFRANGLARSLVRRMVRAPRTIAANQSALAQFGMSELPTSVDNMSPDNKMIRTLADLPIDPAVHANSIVAVKNPGPPDGQNDGVVAYESAHIDGVESELIVHSPHSVQGHPEAIEEVRRILREQVANDRKR